MTTKLRRRLGLTLWVVLIMATPWHHATLRAQASTPGDHVAWVNEVLKRMQTIKPGMTREALLRVFRTEGGLWHPMRRTFISKDCHFFKVDVEFRRATGRQERDVLHDEDPTDVILAISKPYLEPPRY